MVPERPSRSLRQSKQDTQVEAYTTDKKRGNGIWVLRGSPEA